MTRTFDPSDDLARTADGLEAVTLRRRGSTPGGPGTTIAHALRRSVSVREAAASAGRYTASNVSWHLPVAELDESPRLGDLIGGGEEAGGNGPCSKSARPRWARLAMHHPQPGRGLWPQQRHHHPQGDLRHGRLRRRGGDLAGVAAGVRATEPACGTWAPSTRRGGASSRFQILWKEEFAWTRRAGHCPGGGRGRIYRILGVTRRGGKLVNCKPSRRKRA